MAKNLLLVLICMVFSLITIVPVFAAGENETCHITSFLPPPKGDCDGSLICQPLPTQSNPDAVVGICITGVQQTFGRIEPPGPLKKLLGTDQTGAGAISRVLSNFVTLIFSIAAVVLLFMILWGAFDWIISEGDKEKVASARSKIINAMIGIFLFALAFAILRLFGQFTGFSFFKNSIQVNRDSKGNIIEIICPDGQKVFGTQDPVIECKGHGT